MNHNGEFLSREALEKLEFLALGHDVRIHRTCVLVNCGKISVGSQVRIDPFVVLSAQDGIVIGRNVHIAAHASLIGRAMIRVSDFAGISQGVRILSETDDFTGPHLSGPTVPLRYRSPQAAEVVVGRHVIVGVGTTVLPGCRIGEGATLGALSLAKGELEPWMVFAGVPARKIRARSKALLALEREYLEEG